MAAQVSGEASHVLAQRFYQTAGVTLKRDLARHILRRLPLNQPLSAFELRHGV